MYAVQPRRLQAAFAYGALDAAATDTDTALTSAQFATLPVVSTREHLPLVLGGRTSNVAPEIVYVLAHAANSATVTVVRGQEGTAARAHAAAEDWQAAPLPSDLEAQPVLDTRSVPPSPSAYARQTTWEFKALTSIGLSSGQIPGPTNSGYAAVQTVSGWQDDTGGRVIQIAYVVSGSTGTAPPARPLQFMRYGDRGSNTWSNWHAVHTLETSVPFHALARTENLSSLNAQLASGFYEIAPGGTGAPTNDWYHVIVQRHTNTNDNRYISQQAAHFFTMATYQRRCYGGDPTVATNWTAWEKIGGGDLAWTNVSSLGYANGWRDYDTGIWLPQFRKDAQGYVHMRGLIALGTASATAFTMPMGYRPARSEMFSTFAGAAVTRSDVNSNGTFVAMAQIATGATNAYVSLSGITYLAEQ